MGVILAPAGHALGSHGWSGVTDAVAGRVIGASVVSGALFDAVLVVARVVLVADEGLATVKVDPVTSSTGAPVIVEDCPMMIDPERLLRSSSAC